MTSSPDADSLVLDLTPPLVVKGITYDALRLQEPRAEQVRKAAKKLDANLSEASVTDYQVELVRLVADVPEDVVNALAVRQLGAAYEYVAGFVDAEDEEDLTGDELPGTFDMPLDPPLSWNGGQVHGVTLREPTAEQLRKARNHMRAAVTPFTVRSYEMALLEMVSGLNAAVIHGMRIRDLTRASRHLARFIDAGRKTGKR